MFWVQLVYEKIIFSPIGKLPFIILYSGVYFQHRYIHFEGFILCFWIAQTGWENNNFDLKKFCEIYSYIINNIFPIIKNDLISLSRYIAHHEKRVGNKKKNKTKQK